MLLKVVALSSALFVVAQSCCGTPMIITGCCQQYAPPRVIGYNRIPIYKRVRVQVPVISAPPPPPVIHYSVQQPATYMFSVQQQPATYVQAVAPPPPPQYALPPPPPPPVVAVAAPQPVMQAYAAPEPAMIVQNQGPVAVSGPGGFAVSSPGGYAAVSSSPGGVAVSSPGGIAVSNPGPIAVSGPGPSYASYGGGPMMSGGPIMGGGPMLGGVSANYASAPQMPPQYAQTEPQMYFNWPQYDGANYMQTMRQQFPSMMGPGGYEYGMQMQPGGMATTVVQGPQVVQQENPTVVADIQPGGYGSDVGGAGGFDGGQMTPVYQGGPSIGISGPAPGGYKRRKAAVELKLVKI